MSSVHPGIKIMQNVSQLYDQNNLDQVFNMLWL